MLVGSAILVHLTLVELCFLYTLGNAKYNNHILQILIFLKNDQIVKD